uniref:SAND domain-containing protein n=1 Tax=Plectus sambesii TaxID=2011161 RepID=A0A914XJE6_9BILA
METSPIDDVKFESSSNRTTTYVIVSSSGAITGAIDAIEDGNRHGHEDIDGEEMSSPRSMERVHSTQQSHAGIGHVTTGEDDDKTSSTTVSTLEASSSGLAGTFDDSGGFRLENDMNGNGDDNDIASLHGDGSNVNIDWLTNQMQIAINSGVLDVTCKNFHGQLHLDKFGSGNRGKCIYAYNQWFTPSEFEAFCGRAQCKDWKRSVKFQERSLLQLIELDILKVHAVSCTCGACWNGESEGPIRYHDVKRKSSTVHPALAVGQSISQTATKRLYTHSTTRNVLNEHHYAEISSPVKQLKIEMPSSTGQ